MRKYKHPKRKKRAKNKYTQTRILKRIKEYIIKQIKSINYLKLKTISFKIFKEKCNIKKEKKQQVFRLSSFT